MLVKKRSWHYILVAHKETFKPANIRGNNTLLLDYLHEVWMGIYCYILIIPIVATLAVTYHAPEIFGSHPILFYGFVAIFSSPVWLAIVFGITGLLMKKSWQTIELTE